MKMKSKKPSRQFVDENPIEALRNIGSGVVDSFAQDLGKESVNSLWEQMLGQRSKKQGGDLSEGQELELSQLEARQEHSESEPGIDYRREILHAEKRTASENQHEIKVKIEEIMIEIRKLISSSNELSVQFKEVEVSEVVEKPGKYHLNFVEWLLDSIRAARVRIEDGSAWLEAFYSKKNKKKYWNMFKKHGTSFGLSNERSVSTQTG